MTNKYYIDSNSQKSYTLEELRQQTLTRETLVWYNGLDNWVELKDAPELSILLDEREMPKSITISLKLIFAVMYWFILLYFTCGILNEVSRGRWPQWGSEIGFNEYQSNLKLRLYVTLLLGLGWWLRGKCFDCLNNKKFNVIIK